MTRPLSAYGHPPATQQKPGVVRVMQLPLQQSALVVHAQLFGWQLPASTWHTLLTWHVPFVQTFPAEHTLFGQHGSPGYPQA